MPEQELCNEGHQGDSKMLTMKKKQVAFYKGRSHVKGKVEGVFEHSRF